MYQYYDYDNEQHIQLLVEQFEEMKRNGSVGFFEVTSFLKLLEYYESKQQLDIVNEILEHGLSQHPTSAILLIRQANFLFDNDKVEEALSTLEQAELVDAGEIELYFLKAEILTYKRQYNQAQIELDKSLAYANDLDYYDILLHRANVYEDEGNFNETFEVLKDALLLNPTGEEALDRMWLTVELSEKYDESIALHNKLLDKDAYSYQAWFNLGHAHFCKREYKKAAESYDFSFTINEKFEPAYRDCAESLMHLGEFLEAASVYKRAIRNTGANAFLYLQVGTCYEELEQYYDAREFYLKAAKQDPQNGETYFRIGETYVKEDRWVNAISAYRKAIKLDELNPKFYAAIAETFYQLDEVDNAGTVFRHAISLEQKDKDIWVSYVSFLIDIESFEEAYNAIEAAQENIDATELLYCKVACLHLNGKHKASLEMLAFALSEDYTMHESLFELFPELEKVSALRLMIDAFDNK
ncbi:MAG: tetratricopeptide (TPR) repeat protein [Cognaticolwellia sp.]|jgi:tetratricopeptide (TPR) repeat protein